MKNFSVKTADFDSLSISGESPIVQSDLGTAPNQIPLNKDLGSLAYMNAPQIEDLNVDTLELREIAAELSETAVDVFVYDTRKDSDGGAWRERTSHTSWYNEELNTTTRGGRREFPAVAVIVAETNKVTIYDGDDPDLSMWMVFEKLGTFSFVRNNLRSVFALNGELCIGIGNAGGLSIARFANDSGYTYFTSERRTWSSVIATRTELVYDGANDTSIVIVNNTINDVAMTVLPNAPIDSETGLPVPTIAVATDAGVSVIRDDGSVVDITRGTGSSLVNSISFDNNNKLIINNSGTGACYYNIDIPSVDLVQTEFGGYVLFSGSVPASNVNLVADSKVIKNYVGHASSGLNILEKGPTGQSDGMIAYTTSTYNTGWMPGDIKLATLSDTKNETVGVDETNKLIDEKFNTDASEAGFTATYPNWGTWEGTCSVVDNQLRVIVSGTSVASAATTNFATIIGEKYVVSFDYELGTADKLGFWIDDSNATGQADIYNDSNITSGSTRSVEFTATSTTTYLVFLAYGTASSTDYGVFDNISVKQTGELITNGTFDDGTTGWIAASNWTVSGGVATTTAVNSSPITDRYLTQSNALTIGQKYTLSGTITSADARTGNTELMIRNGTTNELVFILESSTSYPVNFTYTFVAAGEDFIFLTSAASGGAEDFSIDNISVRLAEDDRSVNNNGLQVFGEIDKTPVAPGADLVAYSGFSANNYLMQPYNSDLNFGTGDFCVMGWHKGDYLVGLQSTTDAQKSLPTGGDFYADNNFAIYSGNSGRIDLIIGGTSYSGVINNVLINGIWQLITVVRKNGVLKVYVNDELTYEALNSKDVNNVGGDLYIAGYWYENNLKTIVSYSEVSLLRISKTAPTAEQIAKIYRDEKPLFQDGAQATLYGTSDAVTALAYDDSENLLHVGTASGRSSFNGLKRVDNTTTAVTTAISATEGLVIEQ